MYDREDWLKASLSPLCWILGLDSYTGSNWQAVFKAQQTRSTSPSDR